MSRRLAAVLGLLAAGAIVVLLLGGGNDSYMVRAQMHNAGGLRTGFKVRVDGVPVGKVTKVDLGHGDLAIAEADIEKDAAPLGRDARATVRAINILGEKYLDIDRGDTGNPAPSGFTIPVSQTGQAVELDDLIDALDLPTRAALNVILDEAGRGLGGRGRDLASAVAALPPALDRTGALLRQLGVDNHALGRLVDDSDRVVARVAAQRASLGRLVSGAATTLDTLGGRHRQLGQTVRSAPATLTSLRRALGALHDAAIPLRPAARGLRATAPALTATLQALPSTAEAARPALRAARKVAPALERLGTRGTPVARNLRPLASRLATWSSDVEPGTKALDDGWADLLGVMEAWARATGPRDTSGHIFRLAVGGGADLLAALAGGALATTPRHAAKAPSAKSLIPAPAAPSAPSTVRLPRVRVPEIRLPRIPGVNAPAPDVLPAGSGPQIKQLLDYLLGP